MWPKKPLSKGQETQAQEMKEKWNHATELGTKSRAIKLQELPEAEAPRA